MVLIVWFTPTGSMGVSLSAQKVWEETSAKGVTSGCLAQGLSASFVGEENKGFGKEHRDLRQ